VKLFLSIFGMQALKMLFLMNKQENSDLDKLVDNFNKP
jgi:hypothetical protein